ncbi:MAG: hypothetical protein NWE83_08065 [Candidatus Bathyarchaeota archaeon]|nr:hypothetical protein [Candidatus Bathyarchaeota archaeon]
MKVTCITCSKEGTLCLMIHKIRGQDTEHYYVQHQEPDYTCYIGTSDALPYEYRDKLKTFTYFGSQLKRINASEKTPE